MKTLLIKVIFGHAFLLLLTAPLLSQDIMSFEQYQKVDHEEPYIYRIESNSGTLLYFGSRHSFDPSDPQMDSLTQAFNQFAPDVVITESFPKKFDYSLNKLEAIKTNGEFGLTWKLANEQNIPIHSIEPEKGKEVDYLKNQGWTDTQLMLFYTLRQVAQSHEQQQSENLSALVPEYLTSLKQRFGLNGPTTLEAFENAVKKLLPSVRNWKTIPTFYFYPGPQDPEYFTNRIATDSNIFRDKYHVEVITEAVQKGQKVFVIVGSAHAVMQEPALRSILGKK